MKHWWMNTETVTVEVDDVIEHIPFEKLEEVMVQELGSISDLIGIQTENDINIYQFYEIWFSSLLTSTTLDE